MYTEKHCIDGGGLIGKGYVNNVLVIDPEALDEETPNPDAQLFYCSDRCYEFLVGCHMATGEGEGVHYGDFIGVMAPEHLPDWAVEKLEQLRSRQVNYDNEIDLSM